MPVQHLHIDERCFSCMDLNCVGFSPQLMPPMLLPGQAGSASHNCPSAQPLRELFWRAGWEETCWQHTHWVPGCVCVPGCWGFHQGEVPNQMLLLSATSTPCINNPAFPFSLTFVSQPCQTSSVQIQTYHSHTSVPARRPWGFWAPIPARGDGDVPHIGNQPPPPTDDNMAELSLDDHSSIGFGISAFEVVCQEIFHGKRSCFMEKVW